MDTTAAAPELFAQPTAQDLRQLAASERAYWKREGTRPALPSLRVAWGWVMQREQGGFSPQEVAAHLAVTNNTRVSSEVLSSSSATKYREIASELAAHLEAVGIIRVTDVSSSAIDAWLASYVLDSSNSPVRPSNSTVRLRKTVALQFLQTAVDMGALATVPRLSSEFAAETGSATHCRPLTDQEIHGLALRASNMEGTRTPVCLALAMSGAATNEIGLVSVGGVDLHDKTLRLPGTYRTTPRCVRFGSEWAAHIIESRVQAMRAEVLPLPGHDRIGDQRLVRSSCTTPARLQSSISQTLGELLRSARITAPEVQPASIPAWAAAKVWESSQHDLFEVARFLGTPRLDLAAKVLALDWADVPPVTLGSGPGRA